MAIEITLTHDIALCQELRRQVFVGEQNVPLDEEVDGRDADALHFLARVDGAALGTARVLVSGDTAKIGRVCVLAPARGTGLGAALMRAVVADLRGRAGLRQAVLGSQTHAIGFYEKLGFTAFGPEYDDAGIAHRDMRCLL